MEGAKDLSSLQGSIFYTVTAALDDVANFYRTEMVAAGYTPGEESGGSNVSFMTLNFSKDGENVAVQLFQNGDDVTVTIAKE